MMIGKKERMDVVALTYKSHPHAIDGNKFCLTNGKDRYPINIFGSHNLLNISGAREVLKKLGITNEQFYEAIPSFKGASGRLEKVYEHNSFTAYKDFAHAPSKVKATVKAVKELNGTKDVVACLELHTYSSLNKKFLPQYRDSMKLAQTAIVYFNPEKVKNKNLEPISVEEVKKAFNLPSLNVFTDTSSLTDFIKSQNYNNKNLLMMSSGDFGGMDIPTIAASLTA
jgi:UDP-N-acetylmuramate: L-alanyl-gamma-D-glutamyl-meso-diaminopimelate ligase